MITSLARIGFQPEMRNSQAAEIKVARSIIGMQGRKGFPGSRDAEAPRRREGDPSFKHANKARSFNAKDNAAAALSGTLRDP